MLISRRCSEGGTRATRRPTWAGCGRRATRRPSRRSRRAAPPTSGRSVDKEGRMEPVLRGPQAPDGGWACRRPAPGLVRRAVSESGVLPSETLLVGDAERDLEAGRAAGVAVALVRTGKGQRTEAEGGAGDARVF